MSRHGRQRRSVLAMVAFCTLSLAALAGVVAFRLAEHPPGTASAANRHALGASGLTGTAPSTRTTPTASPTPSAQPTPTPTPVTLRQGSAGPDVLALQHRLAALGYQSRAQTGHYDSETMHAVTAFEKLNGLPADGVASPAVLAALDHPVVPRQRKAHRGLAVEVDLARQVAVVYTDGVVSRIYDVCTGRPTMPTPTGEFTVKYKIDGMHHAPLGPMWRPVYFNYSGFAFHGAEPVLTTPSSHGCVRMTDPAMNELYGMLTPGVPVTIF